jgi:hypothetical protein
MDARSVAENTTIVGGPLSHIGDNDNQKEPLFTKGKATTPPRVLSDPKTFIGTADYFETERPFFVSIDKHGIISALNKLDQQLRNVRHRFSNVNSLLTLLRNM